MNKLSSLLLFSVSLPLAIFVAIAPSQAQSTSQGQISNTLKVEKPGVPPNEFSINGVPERVNPASVTGAIVIGAGVEIDPAQLGINMVLAGADSQAVAEMLLALSGVAADGKVDATRLALAIRAFNAVVQKADLESLKALQEIPEFGDIRTYLDGVKKAVSG